MHSGAAKQIDLEETRNYVVMLLVTYALNQSFCSSESPHSLFELHRATGRDTDNAYLYKFLMRPYFLGAYLKSVMDHCPSD
jgi:hypothetical protein